MFKPEQQDHNRPPSEFLTHAEKKLLESLTHSDIQTAKRLHNENLTRRSSEVVGVRTEDLLFLLAGIHQGFLPVERETEPNWFFVETNPDSTFVRQYKPEALDNSKSKRFGDFRDAGNLQTPSQAVKHAVELNLLSRKTLREMLLKDVRNFYREEGFNSDELNLKEFYDDVADDLTRNPNVLRFHSRSRPALDLLARCVERAFSPYQAEDFLRSLSVRKGVLLAFNQKILEKYQMVKTDHGDMVLHVPSGQVELETLLGFESLGDFEDMLLERLTELAETDLAAD